MAIKKKLIHFDSYATFATYKLSANRTNSKYTLGPDGEVTDGDPDILWHSIVYIGDTGQQWTHGKLIDSGQGKEETTNKVTSINSSSTDTEYPSAKAVYDALGTVLTPLVLTQAEYDALETKDPNTLYLIKEA